MAKTASGLDSGKAQVRGRQTPVQPGPPDSASGSESRLHFPVVLIGASAGGLESFTALLKGLPADAGLACVLIQHLDPRHESALTVLLSQATGMPVVEVTDGLIVEANHVYVIPPNKSMTIRQGALHLAPRPEAAGPQLPIDTFAVALSEERGSAAIGVVLSGTGSDGTRGMKAIQAAGGITFAQDPKTAAWPAMPLSVMAAGAASFVFSPTRIATELARIGGQPWQAEARETPAGGALETICLILRAAIGVDFRQYKQATVRRRISRRMALRKIATLEKYAGILRKHPEEVEALAGDIFIHVTSFFRDPECFAALRKHVLSTFPGKRSSADPIRIWVAGCSTGEEVYSIAMLLLEELGEHAWRTPIQIFGSDVSERAVAQARAGIYTAAAVAGISPARLKRFFVKADQGYQIDKSLRDLCVFARHDIARDPPFSRLDLISCRNMLIYIGSALQKRIVSIFQYALKPGGFLFLGSSESISEYSEIFSAEDRKHRIFLRKPVPMAFRGFDAVSGKPRAPVAAAPVVAAHGITNDFQKQAEALLLTHYAPPALIVDSDLHIVHFQGDTSPWLAPATGQPGFNLLKMVRPEFVVDLRTAVHKARKDGVAVQRDGVRFIREGRAAMLRLHVRPLKAVDAGKCDFLVVFERIDLNLPEGEPGTGRQAGQKTRAAGSLGYERELTATREYLRALIAEHETAQEEMKAANEEILSSNEELQSTNEELETAKEELQSSNEELTTLNEELQHRNTELNVLSVDLNSLLIGLDIPLLVLDAGLRVRRFTPGAGTLLNLIPGDAGRPFSNIASNLDVNDWDSLFLEVTSSGRSVEREVGDRSGHRYSLRVRPYITNERKVGGVLVILLDTDLIQRARDETSEYAHAIVETIHQSLVVLNSHSRVLTVNRSFCELFQISPGEILGQPFFGSGKGQIDASGLRALLDDVLAKGTEISGFELDQQIAGIGRRRLALDARPIERPETALIVIEDLTERKLAQEELSASEDTTRALLESATQAIIAVNPDGIIALVNRTTETMFGYRREELLGQTLDILVPDNVHEVYAHHRKAGVAGTQGRQQYIGLEVTARRRDGTTFPVEINLSNIAPAAGRLVVAFVNDITERKRLEQTARTKAEEVRALAAGLLTAQEEERRRVSRELHDQICQQLASLAIDMGGLAGAPPSPKDLRRRLKELQSRVVNVSEEARHIAYELHPSVLDDLGLVASLRALCKEFSGREGIGVAFSSGALPGSIPREAASCLYRAAQESLQNAAKHSGAKHIAMTLALREETLTLEIEDDGGGFDQEAVKGRGGLGLVGLEERVRLVSGRLSISSPPGNSQRGGTRVALSVPLSNSLSTPLRTPRKA